MRNLDKLKICIDYQKKRIAYREKMNALNVVDVYIYDMLREYLKSIVIPEDKPINIGFDKFWFAYDKKVNKKEAELAWQRLTDEEREDAMAHVHSYVKATPNKKYRKDPDRYLKKRAFYNEIIQEEKLETEKPKKWLEGTE